MAQKQAIEEVKQERLQANALVVQQVIGTLARSGEAQRVQVRHLWENRYRVNVLIGDDVPSIQGLRITACLKHRRR